MKRPATLQDRIARARPVAVDALELRTTPAWTAHPGSFERDGQVLKLVKLAVQDYRLRYPSCPATGPWLFYDGNPRTARIRGTPDRVDVYCLFCRVVLVHPAIWQHDYTAQLAPHTTVCALRSLAGLLTPGAPHTYRLPSAVDGEIGA